MRTVRPDFAFYASNHDGTIGASIVDPHGHHLGDALPELRGLAAYAGTTAGATNTSTPPRGSATPCGCSTSPKQAWDAHELLDEPLGAHRGLWALTDAHTN
jgi:hypothetical protein